MATTTSAVELADAHAATLSGWHADLVAIDDEIAALVEEEETARSEFQKANPQKRSDSVLAISSLRKKINGLTGKRQRLAAEITMKQSLLESLEEEAQIEREAQELAEREVEISAAEDGLAEQWAGFVKLAEELQDAWGGVVDAATWLDGFPSGNVPTAPDSFPADIEMALTRALAAPGEKLVAPRITSRRIPTVSTAGTAVGMDTTGRAHTLSDLSDW